MAVKWTSYIADVVEDAAIINSAAGVYGGVALAGEDICYSPSYVSLQAAAADSAGTILWSATDYYMYCDYCNPIAVFGNSTGGCYAAANFESWFPPPMNNDATFSFLPGGDTDWKKKTNAVTCICESADGNAVFAGYSDLVGTDDIIIRKMNHTSGNYMWQHSHGFSETDETCCCIALCEDGGFVIGGFSSPNSLLLRVDSQGLINGTGFGEEPGSVSPGITTVSNPSSVLGAVLQIRVQEPCALEVLVYDAAGRVVFSREIQSAQSVEHITVGSLPAGIYTALVVSEAFGRASCRLAVLN